MSKVCKKCGVKHKNSAYVCMACGEPFEKGRTFPDFYKYSKYIFYGIILALIAVILIIYFTSPETAARSVVKAYKMNDAASVVASVPEFLLESDNFDAERFANDVIYDAIFISYQSFGYRVDNTAPPSAKDRDRIISDLHYYGGDDFDEDELSDITLVWISHDMEYIVGMWQASVVRFVMIKYDGHWYWWPDTVSAYSK